MFCEVYRSIRDVTDFRRISALQISRVLEAVQHTHNLSPVRMDDLEAVVAGVRDPFDAHHLADIVDASPADNAHEHVGHVSQPLQHLLGLLGNGGQVGVGRDRTKSKITHYFGFHGKQRRGRGWGCV